MRLTLRTLLSWKDGMLEPEAARDLAGRVAASPAARGLVARIDDVASRPTLSAPAVDATGFASAANTTAEYLDNVLPPERLGEFERVCFASEAQLAEAAATHEMLAAWSRAPGAPLDASARRRLLAAVRARAAGDATATAAPKPAHGRGERPPGVSPATRGSDAGRPRAAARAAPASAWLLVAAALTLLVALVGVLGWSLTRGGRRAINDRDVAARTDAPAGAGVAPAPPATVATPAGPDVAPEIGRDPAVSPPPESGGESDSASPAAARAPATPAPQTPVATSDEDVPPFARDASDPPTAEPVPPLDEPEGELAAAVTVAVAPPDAPVATPSGDQRVPQGDALAIAAPASRAAQAPDAVAPRVAAPPVAPAGVAVDGPAVILVRSANASETPWSVASGGVSLELPVDLVVPPFGHPKLAVDGLRIALEPGTRAALGRDADGTPRLDVVFGGATVAGGGRLGVTAGGIAGVIDAFGAPVRIAATLDRVAGAAADSTRRTARIVSAGPLTWRPQAADDGKGGQPAAAAGDAWNVPVGREIVWASGSQVVVQPAGPPPSSLTGRPSDDAIDRRAADALSRRLVAGDAAVPLLRELAAEQRDESRIAAAATLALVGEFDALARLFVADGPGALPESLWGRLDAVAVQPALARGPRAADALARAIAAHAPPGAADAVVRFARGFGDDELASGGAAELVAALESPHLVVRRQAIKSLVEITGADGVDRLRYRADRPAEAIRDGAAWWRTRLEQGFVRRGAGGPR